MYARRRRVGVEGVECETCVANQAQQHDDASRLMLDVNSSPMLTFDAILQDMVLMFHVVAVIIYV